jgi:uncharacterized protein YegL
MAVDYFLRQEDLVNNPTARIPVCLCLDTSGSMEGSPIRELSAGVEQFYEAIRSDDIAKYSAEICIVTFGDRAMLLEDFASIERQAAPQLNAVGGTPMGEAVNKALDCLERRKQEYKDKGVDYYQPWLVLMTDGQPNGDSQILREAIEKTVDLVNSKKLVIFPIGIGSGADMKVLGEFSPLRSPIRLQGLKFSEFFVWLGKSVSTVSQSVPGDKISLESPKGWAEL